MSLIKSMRRQTAVWWKKGAPDQYGTDSFDDPVEVKCRWEEVGQEYLSAQGEKQLSRAIVYVDRKMAMGDRLAQGLLDSDTPADPMNHAGSYLVERFDVLPNLRNTENLYTAYL
jgi:hypothetical protein